jgi:hypothetical protein
MTYPYRRPLLGVAASILVLAGCADQATAPAAAAHPIPQSPSPSIAEDAQQPVGYSAYLADVNRRIIALGGRAVIARAELLMTPSASANSPRVVFADNHNLRLDSRWVFGDLRRLVTDGELKYGVFAPLARATVGGPAEASFDATFATWNAVSCSNIRVRKIPLNPARFPSAILNPGIFPPADIVDVGFLPASLLDAVLGPGASQAVVGVTFTVVFIEVDQNGIPIRDPAGNLIPTDIDRDGRFDTAYKEVWFNDGLAYSTNGTPGTIDIETAALLEHGHALELDHFGTIFGNLKTLKLQVSPRAVMNAVVLGTLREPLGTDEAALCGNYASWH